MNGPRVLHLLVGEIFVGIVAKLLRQEQQAVQRRAQLVRHIGQKFRLVLRGERQLRRFFLEGQPGDFHLPVFAFHLGVLIGQQLRLFLQLLVGLLQLFLLALQLLRHVLRLLQQCFGARIGLDGVEDDADAFG